MVILPDLARLRATNEGRMPEPATVSRAGAPLDPQPRMTNGQPLRCRVAAMGQMNTPGGTLLDLQERWLLTLPYQTLVLRGDRITTLGGIYGVSVVRDPTSYQIGVEAVCYLLFSLVDGEPVQLIPLPNAVVTITTREGLPTNMTSVPARIESPTPRDQLLTGGEVKYTVLLPTAADTKAGDRLYIEQWPPFNLDPTQARRVLSASPEGDETAAWVRAMVAERL